jgi:hypothetical protein
MPLSDSAAKPRLFIGPSLCALTVVVFARYTNGRKRRAHFSFVEMIVPIKNPRTSPFEGALCGGIQDRLKKLESIGNL